MRLGRGGGVKGSIIGGGGGGSNIIFPINKMGGVILVNKWVTVCFFVCLLVFFFTEGVVASVWCTSTLKLHQSKHCDK